MDATTSETMSTTEAARLLNVSAPTLRQLLKTGQIAYSLAGTHARLSVEDVEHYIAMGGFQPKRRRRS